MHVRCYEVWCEDSGVVLINHTSLGRAKAQLFYEAQEFRPWVKFTDVKGRLHSREPVTSDRLRRVMEYRSRPDLYAGAEVRLRGGREGVVVDADSGCCFAVLLENGTGVSVHPCDLESGPCP